MAGTLYLIKTEEQLRSGCTCPEARIALPQPTLTPWNGDGWLFLCLHCRRPFTFARAAEIPESLEDLARIDLGPRAPEEAVSSWVEQMGMLLGHVRPDKRYVFFDGSFLPTHAHRVVLEGWFANHDLSAIPQIEAQRNPNLVPGMLESEEYWIDGARQRLLETLQGLTTS